MRPVVLLSVIFTVYVTITQAADTSINDIIKAAAKRSPNTAQRVRRDTSSNDAFTKAFLEELMKELKKLNYGRERYGGDHEDYGVEYVNKRNGFWQPMGGPLPVQTRLASFGSRIEPDRNAESPNGFKGMRYGRR